MKTLTERLFKLSALSVTLTSLCLLAACQGGSFKEPIHRPGTSSEPQTNADLRKVELEMDGLEMPESELETEKERKSFYDDLMGQAPTYSEDDLADDAEDNYQSKLDKKRAEEQRRQNNPEPEQEEEQQQPEEKQTEPTTQPKQPKKKPEQPKQQQQPAPAPKQPEAPSVPAPKVKPQEPPKQQPAPQQPAQPQQPQQPEAQAPAKPKASGGDFCRSLNVSSGRGEADLSELYNDDSELAKEMPTEQLKQLRSDEKKNKFVCILLPVAIRMQEQVYRQRLEILRLRKKEVNSIQLTNEDKTWLAQIKESYLLKANATYAELLERVDIVPLPMLLTQAALESGWGRSRATKELNNLFGMHQGDKSQPCKRGFDTRNACVRQFNSISESVSAFIRLLNTGKYYVKFRETRAQMRRDVQPLDSMKLLKSMPGYNENPRQYEEKINEIMNRSNRFGQYLFKEENVLAEPRP